MAKSINLFFILFGSIVFLHPRNDGVYVSAEEEKRRQLQQVYTQEIGIREKTNKNDGERIADYLRYTNLPEGYAWCAAFVSWCFGEIGLKEPRTAWSPSLFPANRIIWKRGDKLVAADKKVASADDNRKPSAVGRRRPQKGDVFVLYYANLKRIGHAGFVDEWGDKYVITVEGNTNESGSREGDGVYRKRRLVSSVYGVTDWCTPHPPVMQSVSPVMQSAARHLFTSKQQKHYH